MSFIIFLSFHILVAIVGRFLNCSKRLLFPGVNFFNILKVFCAAFLKLQFGFVIFWQNNFGARAACKMLMKLTTGHWSTLKSKGLNIYEHCPLFANTQFVYKLTAISVVICIFVVSKSNG